MPIHACRACVGRHDAIRQARIAVARERLLFMGPISRRDFVRLGAGAVVAGAAAKSIVLEPTVVAAQTAQTERKISFVSIGTGIRGCDLLRSARKVQNGVCVGTADLYEMHRKAGVEAYGADI